MDILPPRTILFQEHGDINGKLTVIENFQDIPFSIQRIFYIYSTSQGIVRGKHANRQSEFVLIPISGSLRVRVYDGVQEYFFSLKKKNEGVYLPKMLWKEMYDFSSDAVLLVLSSCPYNSDEYIRNFNDFVKEVKQNA